MRRYGFGVAGALLLLSGPAWADGHLDAASVRAMVAALPAGQHADLAGRDMRGDDLGGLDLSFARLAGANLARTNLHGTKLVGAELKGADLSGADLGFAWIIHADFTDADLHGAMIRPVVTSTGMVNRPDEAAIFAGADLTDATITAQFHLDDMRGAHFAGAHMSADMHNQSRGLIHTDFSGADLIGADFSGAGLGRVDFRFAKLDGARFTGADLEGADLSGAYLTGADFTGATLTDVKGLPARPGK